MKTRIGWLRGRLSFANVTAGLALFIALGGTSYAAITLPRNSVGTKQLRPGAVRGADVRNGAIQTADMSRRARAALRGERGPVGPPGVARHVQVTSEGRVVGGTGAGSSWSGGEPGQYRLQFDTDVSRCSYSATLTAVPGGRVAEPAAGRITAASAGGPNVVVRTYDVAGAPADQPFHLMLAC